MSILTKYQTDMDQIISNFVPYNNPYIILSWKVPTDLSPNGFAIPQEIRSEVLWSGDINLTYPTDIAATDKYKITGDTSFTIKGWLFPAQRNTVGNIFYIQENFHNSRLVNSVNELTNYPELTAGTYTYPPESLLVTDLETVSANAFPQDTTPITYTTSNAYVKTYL